MSSTPDRLPRGNDPKFINHLIMEKDLLGNPQTPRDQRMLVARVHSELEATRLQGGWQLHSISYEKDMGPMEFQYYRFAYIHPKYSDVALRPQRPEEYRAWLERFVLPTELTDYDPRKVDALRYPSMLGFVQRGLRAIPGKMMPVELNVAHHDKVEPLTLRETALQALGRTVERRTSRQEYVQSGVGIITFRLTHHSFA